MEACRGWGGGGVGVGWGGGWLWFFFGKYFYVSKLDLTWAEKYSESN